LKADAKKNEPKKLSKNKIVTNSDDPFINQMVATANGDAYSPKDNDTLPAKKKTNKKKVDTNDDKPPKTNENNKKSKKTKKSTKETESQDDQAEVSILNLNDKQYLIDDDLNVYDFNDHSLIGKFDHLLNIIV
jgi:hypothetical protein